MIASSLSKFTPVSLSELEGATLMKRIDTKYLLHCSQLNTIIGQLTSDYDILEINGNRSMQYATIYFDTDDKRFYLDHHNGRANRKKIRIRKYVDSDLSFLEIKNKSNNVTDKIRTQIENLEDELSKEARSFLEANEEQSENLEPVLHNQFNRITLVNKHINERVTIDTDLSYKSDHGTIEFDRIAIIEVKQEEFSRATKICQVLKKHKCYPASISKYCLGITNLFEDVKQNRFKRMNLTVKKITS